MNDASHPSKPAFPQPVSGTVVPRFGDIATFMRLPLFRDPADVEIGMVGVPWDGGTTNRPGARHGPRQMRDLSTMMRRVHHVTGVAPYELAKCGDLGDAPVNPASLDDSLERIESLLRQAPRRRRRALVGRRRPPDHAPDHARHREGPAAARHGAFRRPQRHLGHAISAATSTPTARRSAAPSRRACSIPSAWSRSASAARSTSATTTCGRSSRACG